MSHRVKIINNCVSSFDTKVSIALMKNLEKTGKLINFRDNPEVLIASPADMQAHKIIKKYSDIAKKYHKELNGFVPEIFTTEAYLSLWLPGTDAGLHIDSHPGSEHIMYSTVVYLNDDYDGGEIYFPNQSLEIKPSAGDMVLFPSGGHEYFHGVRPVISGKRYTIAMWHTMHQEYCPFDAPDKLSPLSRGPHPS